MTTAMQPPLRPHDRAPALRVGTRGSPLALIQARLFIELLRPACSRVLEEHPIRTTGDAVQNRRLALCSPARWLAMMRATR